MAESPSNMPSASSLEHAQLARPPQPVGAPSVPASTEVPKFRPRACARCSMSKLKCNWLSEPGEAPCERCARSKSECVLPSLKPRGPRRGNPTRVGQLEQKIDGIMSLLTASKHIQQTTPTANSVRAWTPATPAEVSEQRESVSTGHPSPTRTSSESLSQPQPPSQQPAPQQQQQQNAQRAGQSGTPATPVTPSTTASLPREPSLPSSQQVLLQQPLSQQQQQNPPPSPHLHLLRVPPLEHIEIAPGFKITFHDAELAFAAYRDLYSPHFPFIPLPRGMTAYEMFQKQPLLFRVIVQAVTPQSPQTQRDAQRWFREQVSHQIVVEDDKTVALLQSILAHFAWFDFGQYVSPKTTPLLQLAAGLVSDLGLNKPPKSSLIMANSFFNEAAAAMKNTNIKFTERPEHSLENMRAVLGCFYISSISSSLFRHTVPSPFTSYLSHCCDVLREQNEYESDKFLVAIVQMQSIASRIMTILPNPDMDAVLPQMFTAPMYMSMRAIRKDLDALVQSQPPEVRNNFFFWTHYHSIVIRLYEPAIYKRMRSDPMDPVSSVRRTECLWNCLQATRDFFDAYLSIPPAVASTLPFMSTAHLSFGIVTLTRLLFLDDAEWEVTEARRSLDFAGLTRQFEDYFKAVDEYEDSQNASLGTHGIGRKKRYAMEDGRPIFTMYREKVHWIRYWYTTKVPTEPRHGRLQQQPMIMARTGGSNGAGVLRGSQQQDVLPSQEMAEGGNMMDVDMEFEAPTNEFDNVFWQAVFDLDGSWEPVDF